MKSLVTGRKGRLTLGRPEKFLAPYEWEQAAKWHHIWVGSGTGGITLRGLLLFVSLRFPMGNFPRFLSGRTREERSY